LNRKLITILVFGAFLTQFSQLKASPFPKDQFSNLYNFSIDTSYNQSATNPFEILHDNYEDVLFLILSDQKSLFEKLHPNEDLRLDKLESVRAEDTIRQYVTAEIQLQWSVLHWRNGNYIRSGLLLKRAYSTLSELKESNPNFIEVNKSLGILHIILSAIPDEYDWLIRLFGFSNNLVQGLQELNLSCTKPNYFQFESKMLLTYINSFVQNEDRKSFVLSRDLLNENNNMSKLLFLLICNKTAHNKEGIDFYKKTDFKLINPLLEPILDFQIAELNLNSGQYSNSARFYKKFISSSKGNYFQANARLKLFYALYLDNQVNSIQNFAFNENPNDDFTISDKYAKEWFKEGKLPNKMLLKCRLFCDGGYYEIADSIISNKNIKTFDLEDAIEKNYRIARIKQGLGQVKMAESYFKKCIYLQKNLNYYFAPNACLQIGIINQKSNMIDQARFWLKKALDYKNYPYKRIIDLQSKNYLNLI
jgi:hypothetical protein